MQLLKAFDYITEKIDTGACVDIIYTDFSKAFDTVPHHRLLSKLNRYKISSQMINWIRSYLFGRKQRLNIHGVKSGWKKVLSGVPQGSVLGPLLFVIYINDIVHNLTNESLLYADDMKLFGACLSLLDYYGLQNDLDIIVDWTNYFIL